MDILVANIELILISGLDAASLGFGVASTTLQGFGVASTTLQGFGVASTTTLF